MNKVSHANAQNNNLIQDFRVLMLAESFGWDELSTAMGAVGVACIV